MLEKERGFVSNRIAGGINAAPAGSYPGVTCCAPLDFFQTDSFSLLNVVPQALLMAFLPFL